MLVIIQSSFERELQILATATIKVLSTNVVFDRTGGINSKILPEDLRLNKDDLNVNNSHRNLGNGRTKCHSLVTNHSFKMPFTSLEQGITSTSCD